MKNDRMQKAEYLFREIGNIHDRWVTEAISYQKPRRVLPRALLIAASVTLSASLLFAVLVANRKGIETLLGKLYGLEDSGEVSIALSTETLLMQCRENANAHYTVVSGEAELNFFSESAHVVWQYENDSALYVSRALNKDEVQLLNYHMQYGDRPEASSDLPTCKVWIVYGDGSVVSPYLQSSNGNVGAGELFDYNAEVIPNADFTFCLSDILY